MQTPRSSPGCAILSGVVCAAIGVFVFAAWVNVEALRRSCVPWPDVGLWSIGVAFEALAGVLFLHAGVQGIRAARADATRFRRPLAIVALVLGAAMAGGIVMAVAIAEC